jgi:hypothetical protein
MGQTEHSQEMILLDLGEKLGPMRTSDLLGAFGMQERRGSRFAAYAPEYLAVAIFQDRSDSQILVGMLEIVICPGRKSEKQGRQAPQRGALARFVRPINDVEPIVTGAQVDAVVGEMSECCQVQTL